MIQIGQVLQLVNITRTIALSFKSCGFVEVRYKFYRLRDGNKLSQIHPPEKIQYLKDHFQINYKTSSCTIYYFVCILVG